MVHSPRVCNGRWVFSESLNGNTLVNWNIVTFACTNINLMSMGLFIENARKKYPSTYLTWSPDFYTALLKHHLLQINQLDEWRRVVQCLPAANAPAIRRLVAQRIKPGKSQEGNLQALLVLRYATGISRLTHRAVDQTTAVSCVSDCPFIRTRPLYLLQGHQLEINERSINNTRTRSQHWALACV